MTLILLAAVFVLVYAIAARAWGAVADRQLRLAEERFADQVAGIDVPLDGPPMVVIPMQQVYDELHLALWGNELKPKDHE